MLVLCTFDLKHNLIDCDYLIDNLPSFEDIQLNLYNIPIFNLISKELYSYLVYNGYIDMIKFKGGKYYSIFNTSYSDIDNFFYESVYDLFINEIQTLLRDKKINMILK